MALRRTVVAASLVAALAFGGTASAHPRLTATMPAANSAVPKVGRIQLKFSEKLIGGMTAADVTMIGMPGHGPMRVNGFTQALGSDGKTLTLARARPLSVGTYRVSWHAVSVDTHRVAGSFKFAVK